MDAILTNGKSRIAENGAISGAFRERENCC